ncbi:LemA family protein [Pseudorhodoferax sp.]|uniref:LemA family protein n=1 Tax=Pseudorhodoferax sp. TaxID=1993553 RepID=UPI0039E6B95E
MTGWVFSGPVLWGGVAAVLLFWGVGAYNRLVRLRAKLLSVFASLVGQFERYQAWIAEHVPPAAGDGPPRAGDPWRNLQAAGAQFGASLAAVRSKPSDGPAMAGLTAARAVLLMAWQYLDDDTLLQARSGLPVVALRAEWESVTAQVQAAERAYAAVVELHNRAVRQFPAVLLAWLFGFKRARVPG